MSKQDLSRLIEEKRLELIHLASTSGYTSTAVIRHSQELDELLNTYHNMKNTTNQTH